jgi:hypothetical protein
MCLKRQRCKNLHRRKKLRRFSNENTFIYMEKHTSLLQHERGTYLCVNAAITKWFQESILRQLNLQLQRCVVCK